MELKFEGICSKQQIRKSADPAKYPDTWQCTFIDKATASEFTVVLPDAIDDDYVMAGKAEITLQGFAFETRNYIDKKTGQQKSFSQITATGANFS